MADCDLDGTHGAACADSLHAVRLPTTKVWRAFPELDRFSDEQCARFAKAARRGAGRVWRWCSVGAVLAICWAAAALFMLWASARGPTVWDRFERRSGSVGLGVLLLFVSALVVFVLATAPAVLLRDRLLRRRILRIVRLRGRCFACKYNLLGLPVGAGLLVTCPECGETTTVDPALGELAQDDAGQARFQPRPDQFPEYRAFFTPARVRAIGRWSLRIGVFLFMLVGGLLIYHEFRIRADARRAAADRAGPDGLPAFVQRIADKAAGEKVNGWAVMMEAYGELRGAEGEVMARLSPADTNAEADVAAVFSPYAGDDDNLRVRGEKNRALGARVIAEAQSTGVFGRLDRIRAVAHAARPLNHEPDRPAVIMVVPELAYVRHLARVQAARLFLAAEAGDFAQVRAAAETGLSIARLVGQQPLVIDKLVGVAVETLALGQLRELIVRTPSAGLLEAAHAALEAQPPADDQADWLDGEHAATLDSVRWLYADASNVRWGWFSAGPALRPIVRGEPIPFGAVPYYAATLAQIDADFAAAARDIGGRPLPAATIIPPSPPRRTLPLDAFSLARTDYLTRNLSQREFTRRGLRALIAIERYRLAHNAPPPTLDALVPDFLSAVPIDPYSALPLGYMLIDPATDKHGRCYLLFGAGEDGVFDLPATTNRQAAMAKWPSQAPVGSHKDAVFNTPDK